MTHPLVTQLRFTRAEFQRALEGLSEEDACKRLLPMNCISWNVGHLAWQEQRYFLWFAQDKILIPRLNEEFRFGGPASTPSLAEMQEAWRTGKPRLFVGTVVNELWEFAAACDLSLLVSHRREHGNPAVAQAQGLGGFRG